MAQVRQLPCSTTIGPTANAPLTRPLTRAAGSRLAALFLGIAVTVSGCTADGGPPRPTDDADSAERVAAELATGLAKKNVSTLEFAGSSGTDVNRQLTALVRGMGPLAPAVTVRDVDGDSEAATATLGYSWTFPGVPQKWTYDASAQLVNDSGRWKTRWQPTVLEPSLDETTRLTQRRVAAERGEILGDDGEALVQARPVVRYGIDKANVTAERQPTSARRLATLLRIDPARYAAKVKTAGAEAFVEAVTLRATDPIRPPNKTVFAIPGALPIQDEQMLAPTRDFARPILGIVGEASKEIVDASGGAVVGGDQVGLSGLQKRYDDPLRGTPGVQVQVVAKPPSATPSPSASGSASPSGSRSPSPSPTPARTVFEAKPTAGRDLALTLNLRIQQLAEKILADTKPASALVAIRPSTGEVVAAANGQGTNGLSAATVGQYPPGSTFKVATSLALIRAGLTPDSRVTCPTTVTVDGRKFENYSDYPADARGTITLRTAVAQSCNTAFIGQRGRLKGDALAQAAASLGVGTDYDVGFSSFFGSVPADKSATGQAAAMIGQGKVQASPMAMASVIASVAAGRTVIPHLVADTKATSKAKPLTSEEADQLRELLGAVVSEGSGRILEPLEPPKVLAKTGTAEYGTANPPKTHAWMMGAQGDLAVAVFVGDGESGSKTAGPLLREFLKAVG